MDKQVKEKWISDLRSGTYIQGRTHLKSTKLTYCCLGVLLEGQNILSSWEDKSYCFKYENEIVGGDKHEEYLPLKFAKEIGIDKDTQKRLGELNDTEGFTFDQIANWIEKNL